MVDKEKLEIPTNGSSVITTADTDRTGAEVKEVDGKKIIKMKGPLAELIGRALDIVYAKNQEYITMESHENKERVIYYAVRDTHVSSEHVKEFSDLVTASKQTESPASIGLLLIRDTNGSESEFCSVIKQLASGRLSTSLNEVVSQGHVDTYVGPDAVLVNKAIELSSHNEGESDQDTETAPDTDKPNIVFKVKASEVDTDTIVAFTKITSQSNGNLTLLIDNSGTSTEDIEVSQVDGEGEVKTDLPSEEDTEPSLENDKVELLKKLATDLNVPVEEENASVVVSQEDNNTWYVSIRGIEPLARGKDE